MENRLKELLLGLILSFLCSATYGEALSPGEELLNDEELLRSRIENMNTGFATIYNDEVKRQLSFMVKTNAKFTESMLGRMMMYYPYIDSLFKANDLPTDLKYITVVESSLKPEVHSHAGAAGLWQFMAATGKTFGLRVNWSVDERQDPFLATQAAVAYLKHLYDIYEDWTLVLMAYNCGPGRLNRAIKLSGSHAYADMVDYLPKETRRYIPKFMAATFFMRNYESFGYKPLWPELDLQIVARKKVYDKISLKEIASGAGVDLNILQILNPALKRDYIPASKTGYYLNYPKRKGDNIRFFLSNYGDNEVQSQPLDIEVLSLVNNKDDEPYLAFNYIVKTGDSWQALSKLLGVNPFLIKYWNNNFNKYLYPGQRIELFLPNSQKNIEFIDILSKNNFNSLKKRVSFVIHHSEMEYVPQVKLKEGVGKIELNNMRKMIVANKSSVRVDI